MNIVNFFQVEQQETLIENIAAGDWGAAKLLAELLKSGRFHAVLGEGTVYLLMEGEKVVSFLTLTRQDCVADENLCPWAGFVYTFPEYRGNRYAGGLLSYVEEKARSNGCEKVYIATDHIGLYEKYGYAYWESRIDVYNEECRIYVKHLGEDQ